MAKFIVIDGLDGCGKATQTELLRAELESRGKKVVKIDFPKYDSDSSAPVRMYLNGELGSNPEELNPYMCSTFYAVDRFIQYVTDWKKYFDEDDNTVIIADRYVSANVIHQGSKIESNIARQRFNNWLYNFECNLCGLPKDDITIILTIKPEVSQRLLTERYNGDDSKKDIHEQNKDYLNNCYKKLKSSIDDMLEAGHEWVEIECSDGDNVLSRDDIHRLIMIQLIGNNII